MFMMKKSIFTLLFLSAMGWVSAQSLQFELNGHVFEQGEKVLCTEATEWGEMLQDMQIHNLTGEAIDVIIEKEEADLVEGTQNYFCWGSCYTPSVFVSPRPVAVEAGATTAVGDLSFHHQIDPEMSCDPTNFLVGTSIVRYYAYPFGNEDDRACVEVWFAYNAEGVVENVVCNFGHAYPNPATSTVRFDYSLTSADKASVSVYNLLGQEVMTQQINSLQGAVTLSVADLNEGIYFCNLFVNGQAVKTEKFVVKK